MKAKILELMQREGLKPGQLAEMLETSPAIISHILSERNKPSLDLLCKILRRFPQINPDWLLLDAPNMYRADAELPTGSDGAPSSPNAAGGKITAGFQGGLFDVAGAMASQHDTVGNRTAAGSVAGNGTASAAAGILDNGKDNGRGTSPFAPTDGFRADNVPVTRVVICYADGSFESFFPTKR